MLEALTRVAVLVVMASAAFCQSAPRPGFDEFEVTSIKPTLPGTRGQVDQDVEHQ